MKYSFDLPGPVCLVLLLVICLTVFFLYEKYGRRAISATVVVAVLSIIALVYLIQSQAITIKLHTDDGEVSGTGH